MAQIEPALQLSPQGIELRLLVPEGTARLRWRSPLA
jgi:hypothetical protein